MSEKYKNACIEYAKASADVRRLTQTIRDASYACWERQNGCGEHLGQSVEHLKLAYEMESEGGYNVYVNHDADVEGYLAETCRHCLDAHLAIQERKQARQRLGIAKRRIGMLGRNALTPNANYTSK